MLPSIADGNVSLLGCCREDDRGAVLAHSSKDTKAYAMSSYGLSHSRDLDGASEKLFTLNIVQCEAVCLAM